jgi:hypothetical protein
VTKRTGDFGSKIDGIPASGAPSADAVTLVEVAAPEEGGVREAVLAANRSESPPSPAPAKRMGWNHPVARIVTYTLIVIVLTLVFLVLLINVFHLG